MCNEHRIIRSPHSPTLASHIPVRAARLPFGIIGYTTLLFIFCGCAVVKTGVSAYSEREVRTLAQAPVQRTSAQEWLEYARQTGNRPPAERLAAWLGAARAAWPAALSGDEHAQSIYRAAVRQIVRELQKSGWELQPDPGISGIEAIVLSNSAETLLDPRSPRELIPADQIQFRGLPSRMELAGLGLPFVAVLDADAPEFSGQPGIPSKGLTMPVTAIIDFQSQPGSSMATARFQLIRTLRQEEWPNGKKQVPLSKDSSASLAWLISKGTNRQLDLVTLFFPNDHLRADGLFQLEPFDPNRIPVVFVHGLVSHPATWRSAINELQADPVIRKNYQFWLFSYPTGWPVWTTAARLRSELDRFNKALLPLAQTTAQRQKLKQKIIVGHSMGGLVSNLQIREGGDILWRQFSKKSLDDLVVPESTRKVILETVDFTTREDISRIIFVAVPHRGSPMALSLPARWAASRIRFLVRDIQNVRHILLSQLNPEFRDEFSRPLNSLRFLEADSPLVRSILDLPRREEVALHSIIGDRGRGDGQKSSDGVVPFWSSYLEDSKTMKVVPSGHGAHEHPEGIAEIARILRESAPNQR